MGIFLDKSSSTITVGIKFVEAKLVVPANVKDAVEKLKNMVDGRVRVINPLALALRIARSAGYLTDYSDFS